MAVYQIVRLQAVEDKADDLLAMLRQGRDFALTVDGCEGFDVYQGKDDAGSFVMIERWATPEQHQSHFQKNVLETGVADRVSALLARPMEYDYYVQP